MIVSIDPGGSNGWAKWEDDGTLISSGTAVGETEFFQFLFDNPADIYVVEEFKLYPHMSEKLIWSKFPTIQMIGAIKLFAYKRGATIVEQQTSIKDVAYKLSGVPKPASKAKSHRFDAIVHGYYYLYKKGILKGPIA